MKNERNYGIDLLRFVLMYMVCMLHTLLQGGILNACQPGTAAYKTYWLLGTISYCAVDGFAIISGYTATDQPRKYEKLADMWFQAFFYSFVLTMLFTMAGLNPVWEKADIIKCALPVTFGKFWYFSAFFALYFAIPMINKYVFTADGKTARAAFFVLFFLFSCMGFLSDAFKTQGGYSALWLMVLYCIGAFARKARVFERKKSITLILLWAICVLLTWGFHVYLGRERLTSYVSPTVLMSGLLLVILFSRLRLKGTIISKLSPLVFGIYLFQLNPVIWNTCLNGRFAFVAKSNLVMGIVYAFAFAMFIFLSGLFVEFVRSRIAKAIKIPALSRKIVDTVNRVLQKDYDYLPE